MTGPGDGRKRPHAGGQQRAWNVEPEMVGEVILGRFRIERAIGRGGFGAVYRAWDERLQRPVAVKVIESEDAAPRVMREAQAVARLAHRNIATLYELAGDGRPRLPGLGADRGGDAARAGRARGAQRPPGRRDRRRLGRGAGPRAPPRRRPQRRQAREHPRRGRWRGEARRLRDRPDRRRADADGDRRRRRHARLHGARAGRRAAPGPGGRRLLARPDPVRVPVRRAPPDPPGSGGDRAGDRRADRPPRGRAPGPARGAGGDDRRRARSRPRAAAPRLRARGGARRPPARARRRAAARGAAAGRGARRARAGAPGAGLGRVAPAASVALLTLVALLVLGGAAGAGAAGRAARRGRSRSAGPAPGSRSGALATVVWLAARGGGARLGDAGRPARRSAAADPAPGRRRARDRPAGRWRPCSGVAGLGAAYPAFAGLFRGPWLRALLGACGYLWLGACEIVADRTFVLGPEIAAPRGWEDSAGTRRQRRRRCRCCSRRSAPDRGLGRAAAVLPLLVRGRSPVLDGVGALIWAAGLISVAPPGGGARCRARGAAARRDRGRPAWPRSPRPAWQHAYVPAPETLEARRPPALAPRSSRISRAARGTRAARRDEPRSTRSAFYATLKPA